MKRVITIVLQLLLVVFASAQDRNLTIQDALINSRTSLAPANLRQLQFLGNGGEYVYLKKQGGEDAWFKGDISGQETPFLRLGEINIKLKSAGIDTLTAFPIIDFSNQNQWKLFAGGNKVTINATTGVAKVIVPKEIASKAIVEESSAGNIAFVDKHNLFVKQGNETIQITSDGSSDIVYASTVHREEFGITKGTFWSNSGNKLAFYRMDQTMVSDYPIIDWTTKPARNVNIKYPMAGEKSHHVTVGVYDVRLKRTVWLKTGEPAEQYLTNIAWSPDDKIVYIAVLNREQNQMKLNAYDAVSGNYLKTLFTEKDEKYVEPQVPMLFLKDKADQFIWESRRDGWNHLYLYNTEGKLMKQLTKGKWEVLEVKKFDQKGENLFYMSTAESPISRNLYQLSLKSGKITRITKGYYNHNAQVSKNGNFVIDNYSGPQTPRNIELIELKSGRRNLLLNAPNPLEGYSLGDVSVFSIKGPSGDSLFCSMRKPANFDASKKYPTVVYWYGGSHAQLVLNSWNPGSGDYWYQYMAERGFVVLVMDTRGSANRGKAFEQSMFRNLGDVQSEDMVSAVSYLKGLPYVDQNNMGLFGWSFGGFNTVNFMLKYPGIFKAAVAGGAVTDWKLYEVMYTERYMDTPSENPEGYAQTDLKAKVEKLQGKLLLIHGLQDPVVVQQHTVNFVKAAVDKGVQVDYMIYPGHEHNVIGKDRAHLYQKVSDYFFEYLKK